MPHLMIDLETMSTDPNAAITQIGAVAFDPSRGPLAASFDRHVCLESCIRAGMKIDGGTICWWLTQAEGARSGFTHGQRSAQAIDTALSELATWVDLTFGAGGPEGVWSHGATFDLPILASAFSRVLGRAVPWRYTADRDTRTLFALAGASLPQLAGPSVGVEHDALDDCEYQVAGVVAAYAKLGLA
jgi:DNA polymerase III epsilon subunit-like protein